MALEVETGTNALDTMLPILPGNRHTDVDYGLGTTVSGGRRQCLRWVVVHIRKGMRDEKARGDLNHHGLQRRQTCGAGEEALATLVNLAEEWARTGIT